MANGEFGNIHPELYIQQDTRACLSACLVIASEGKVTEEEVTEALTKPVIHMPGLGSKLVEAEMLDSAISDLGLSAGQVYDLAEVFTDTEGSAVERLASIQRALERNEKVIIGFEKRREDNSPFTHFAIITGYTETPDGSGVVLVDPSDVDGRVETPTWKQLIDYVKPKTTNLPVIAWSIKEGSEPRVVEKIDERGLPGFDLLANPLYKPEDHGKPVPTFTNHPTSIVMPTYEHTAAWAAGNVDAILSREGRFAYGYPRFVKPPVVNHLAKQALGTTAVLPFPTAEAARVAVQQEEKLFGVTLDIEQKDGIFWVPDTSASFAAWQYAGLGISSRQAEDVLEGNSENDLDRRERATIAIKERIAEHTGADADDIYLFGNGMSAMYWVNKAMIQSGGDLPGAQFGFSYTDTFSLSHFGPHRRAKSNVLDIRSGDLDELAEAVGATGLRSVFTEYPSNPLLWTPNLDDLAEVVGEKIPIIVDDTIASIYNLDDKKLPDSVVARVTSLTKWFSSYGDVMGGSVILRPGSPHYEKVKEFFEAEYTDNLWYRDAEALQRNSRIFEGIMPIVNENGEVIAKWLDEEFAGENGPIARVLHPSTNPTKENYDRYKKQKAGGYGGMLSLEFRDPDRARSFYNALEITKGPSLGTYFSLACLYTYLAHRDPKDVKKFGVDQDLVRISFGIEDKEELKVRLERALTQE